MPTFELEVAQKCGCGRFSEAVTAAGGGALT